MYELVEWKNRFYTTYDPDGNRVHVKHYSGNISVRVTQWNYDHFKMTYAWSVNDSEWIELERDILVHESQEVDPLNGYTHLVIATKKPVLMPLRKVSLVAMLSP